MADKKTTRRAVALPRLHKSIEDFMVTNGIGEDQPVGKLLDAVRDAWFKEAKNG